MPTPDHPRAHNLRDDQGGAHVNGHRLVERLDSCVQEGLWDGDTRVIDEEVNFTGSPRCLRRGVSIGQIRDDPLHVEFSL